MRPSSSELTRTSIRVKFCRSLVSWSWSWSGRRQAGRCDGGSSHQRLRFDTDRPVKNPTRPGLVRSSFSSPRGAATVPTSELRRGRSFRIRVTLESSLSEKCGCFLFELVCVTAGSKTETVFTVQIRKKNKRSINKYEKHFQHFRSQPHKTVRLVVDDHRGSIFKAFVG